MLDTRPALIVAVILGLLLGTFLHAAALAITVHGKLLADENSAEEGRFYISGDDETPLCAVPESYLQT